MNCLSAVDFCPVEFSEVECTWERGRVLRDSSVALVLQSGLSGRGGSTSPSLSARMLAELQKTQNPPDNHHMDHSDIQVRWTRRLPLLFSEISFNETLSSQFPCAQRVPLHLSRVAFLCRILRWVFVNLGYLGLETGLHRLFCLQACL